MILDDWYALNKPEKHTERLVLRIGPKLKAALAEYSAKEDRDMSQSARIILRKELSEYFYEQVFRHVLEK
ncbi:MAG: hypothetical protein OXI59_03970 [Gemmatimonadota bacterium]|nr:hypothetical protein [Gemmatimonadota bacterium]